MPDTEHDDKVKHDVQYRRKFVYSLKRASVAGSPADIIDAWVNGEYEDHHKYDADPQLPDINMTVKTIPDPLYPCCSCYDDYSWSAKDLFWSEPLQAWCCENCWGNFDSHWIDDKTSVPLGISLANEIQQASSCTNNETSIEELSTELNIALTMLAEWAVCVHMNGSDWDSWDEHYKEVMYRPGPLRNKLNRAIDAAEVKYSAV